MLFEQLDKQEVKMIENYIDRYAGLAKKRTASIEQLLNYWDTNKSQYLYKLLGNQFIYRTEIEVVKEMAELADDIADTCTGWHQPGEKFYSAYEDFVRKYYPNYRYIRYIDDTITFDVKNIDTIGGLLMSFIDTQVLAANIYEGPTFELYITDKMEKPYKIQHGCKILKVLGHIANLFDLPGFEEFRLAHSRVLNERSFKGELCISIHPFDFITMSDNDNNWESCMNWLNDGEYKRGTIEMMNSPMVVVAYLPAKNVQFTPDKDITWNSKKWRELFIVTPDIISGVKGYPFWNSGLETQVIKILKQLAEQNLEYGPYNNEPIHFCQGESFVIPEFEQKHIVQFYTDAMYNDFYGKGHQCIIAKNAENHLDITYSGVGECLCCGDACGSEDFYNEGCLICVDCDDRVVCKSCGDLIYKDEAICVDGNYYCEYCIDEYYHSCSNCGTSEWVDNMTPVHLADLQNGRVFTHRVTEMCQDCCQQLDIKQVTIDLNNYWERQQFVIDYRDERITSYMWNSFGFCDIDDFLATYKEEQEHHETRFRLCYNEIISSDEEQKQPIE